MLIKKERIPVVHILLIGLLPSVLKKLIYRLKGYQIGKNVSLSPGAVIIGKKVTILDGTKIGFFTIIRGKEIHIGRYVKIGSMSVIDTEKIFIDEDARINEQVYIGGMKTPQSSFHLGKRTIIMQMSYLNPTLPIVIGDDSGIGGHCLFFTHGSWNSQLEGFPIKFAPITLGKKVWLPWRVFVMPGVTLGDECVIGANSLITSDIPANSLAAGNPAKVIRENFPKRPDDTAKETMITGMFNDFFEYLEYCGFTIQKTDSANGFIVKITGDNKSGILIYITNNSIPDKPSLECAVVYTNADASALKNLHAKGFQTVVSLNSNLRIGTGDTGEEIIGFFSRYGVRFSRLD
jgi:acetyltransferase-like isoleucine patch superfamily enzyme